MHTQARKATTIVGVVAALGVVGCGGSTKSTTVTPPAKTVTVTTSAATSANPQTQSNPAQGHDYPREFATSFMKACTRSGTNSQCTCALSNIESHVPYATVVREAQAGTFIGSPEYKLAVTTCVGR
jgi:hypothetical protein